MNLLIDHLPKSVKVNGQKYSVNWGFKTFLLIEELMEEEELNDDAKMNLALKLFYGEDNIPEDTQVASQQLISFYLGGSSPDVEDVDKTKPNTPAKRVLNYAFDHERIFTAFLRTYNINLATVKNLHWYEFKAMFQDLLEDCQLVKVIGYRTINLGEIKDRKQQKFYRDMKRKYALPLSKKAQDEFKRIEAVLMGDGDLVKG